MVNMAAFRNTSEVEWFFVIMSIDEELLFCTQMERRLEIPEKKISTTDGCSIGRSSKKRRRLRSRRARPVLKGQFH